MHDWFTILDWNEAGPGLYSVKPWAKTKHINMIIHNNISARQLFQLSLNNAKMVLYKIIPSFVLWRADELSGWLVAGRPYRLSWLLMIIALGI